MTRLRPSRETLWREVTQAFRSEVFHQVLEHVAGVRRRIDRPAQLRSHAAEGLDQRLDGEVLTEHGRPLLIEPALDSTAARLGFALGVEGAREGLAAGPADLGAPPVADLEDGSRAVAVL